MARRSFHVIDITEILIHWYAGRSQYELADSLGVDRKTIRKYLAAAVAAGMVPGGPPVSEADWAGMVRSWFPQRHSPRAQPTCARTKAVWRHAVSIAGQDRAIAAVGSVMPH
jgi:hypothetical protein